MQDYLTWNAYPFNVDGVDFVSYVRPNSEMLIQVSQVPAQIFEQMNQSAIRELVGKVSLFTKSEILERLDEINKNYHSAYLALA